MTQLKHWRTAHVILCAPLLSAIVCLTGCGLTRETHRVVELARRTTITEPRFFDYVHNDKLAQREARLRAEQAWAEVAPSVPDVSPDYENGFTEGFADYLYRGGEGEPPLIPPRGYWNLRFLNQFGKRSTNDWYAGFRHGAQTCKASGLRDMWTVPTSLLLGEDFLSAEQSLMPDMSFDGSQVLPTSPASTAKPLKSQTEDPVEPENSSGDVDAKEEETKSESNEPTVDAESRKRLNDPFEDEPLAPEAPLPNTSPKESQENGAESDLFNLPDDVFESSDSFQPDVDELDFNFQSRNSKEQAPVSIKTVQPPATIPSPIVLTSGEYEDDLPPPPKEWPVIDTELESVGAINQRVIPVQDSRPLQETLPKGRPRMPSPRRTSVPTPTAPVNEQTTPIRSAVRSAETFETRVVPKVPASPKPPVDESLLLDLPPLQLTRANVPRPEVPAMETRPTTDEAAAPVVMWLDKNLPPAVEATKSPENVRIQSQDWDPFVGSDADAESSDFYRAPNYDSVLSEAAMLRATKWHPQREKELPLRLNDVEMTESQQMAPIANKVEIQERTESEPLPRIQMHQSVTPEQNIATGADGNDPSTNWRFRD